MQHICDTKRLKIFQSYLTPYGKRFLRTLYVAFRMDEDRPMPCATCLVGSRGFVDWIEVTSEYRRQGFGTEFLRAIKEHHFRQLFIEDGSDSGAGFVEAVSEFL